MQQTVFEVSAAASAAPSGTGAKEYNKLRRIVDEQGGHIEEAMDGVESVANKVEVLDAEVKDVWRKFPPAFEDMRKKQGGLQGDFDVLNKSTALLRLEHDRNFVSHEALHGASKQMKSDLQHTMDKVAALEVAKMGVRLPPGVLGKGVSGINARGGGWLASWRMSNSISVASWRSRAKMSCCACARMGREDQVSSGDDRRRRRHAIVMRAMRVAYLQMGLMIAKKLAQEEEDVLQ